MTFVRHIRFSFAAAMRRTRPLFAVLFGAFIASHSAVAAPTTPEPLETSRLLKSLAAFSEPDMLETAYREGVSQYEDGEYVEAARTWLTPAKYGHAGAQFSLGVAYATGNGVAQDLSAAIRWWNEAARRGHAAAQVNLGLLYWRGVGVEKDISKARSWWRRAADSGDAAAQFHLGAMAATGEGGPLDFDSAIHWWRLSAAQGYELAIEGLQIMERHGFAVDKWR